MVTTTNLVGYWKMDESSGDMIDAHGSDDGTVSGATQNSTGIINTGYSFDGTNDDVALALNDRTTNFTYNFWAYKTTAWSATADKNNFLEHTGTGTTGILIGYSSVSGKPQAVVHDGSSWHFIGSTTVSANAWHMYTLTYDGTTVKYYIDGVNVGTSTQSVLTSLTSFKNLAHYGGSYCACNIDEMGIWSRAITSTEVGDLYNSGSGLAYPFSVAGTKFQLNIGDTWKGVAAAKINIGDSWKDVTAIKQNIGDSWKTV